MKKLLQMDYDKVLLLLFLYLTLNKHFPKLERVYNFSGLLLQNNLKPVNNNNSQIIIHNYPNAPNLSFPENIISDEALEQYIQLGGIRGMGKFISDNWAKDINPVF